MLVPCGVQMAIPAGHVGLVCPRSGLSLKEGITVHNGPGVVDSGYRGEVGAILYNTDDRPKVINFGDRVAQMVIVPVVAVRPVEVESLDETERGVGGFGHTGK